MKCLRCLAALIILFSLTACGNRDTTTVAIMTKLQSGSIVDRARSTQPASFWKNMQSRT